MRKNKDLQRIVACLLCVFMVLGNVFSVSAAEQPPQTAAAIEVLLENAAAEFDKEEYTIGDVVNVTLVPEEGYHLTEQNIKILQGEAESVFEVSEEDEIFRVSFVITSENVTVTAEAEAVYQISFLYKDMNGNETAALFETAVNTAWLLVGTEVTVSVNYKGSIGWAASVSTESGSVSHDLASDSLSFIMPAENVQVELQEMEVYNKGDLSTEDSVLGEDIGKDHQITTGKAYEPQVSLGKSAKWDDIEKGTATLTLTQKSTSNWSDNPSDYIIVLDRTVSMAVDYSSVYGSAKDDLGFGSSVCLNPKHFYMYQGKPAKLIDYGHGFFISSGNYFSTESYMGSEEALWKQHYDSSGKRIDPRVRNGCTDRLTIAQNSIRDILDVLDAQNKKQLAGGKKNRVMYWSFSGSNQWNNGTWNEVPKFTEDMSAVKNAIRYESYPGTYYYRSFEQILKKLEEKKKDPAYQDIPTKVIFISDGMLYDKNTEEISGLAKKIRETSNTKLYTILIGNSKDSEAGKILKSYATSPAHFATVTSNWDVFVNTITAIQKDQFEIKAADLVVTDEIAKEYWEVQGEPVLEAGNGTASFDQNKTTLTWKLPVQSGKTFTCKVKLKLKDQYRYLLSDTSYPTNADEKDAGEEQILKDPTKAGGRISYRILGGKYNGETRTAGVKTPKLKYGTVEFSGTKKWTVAGSYADTVKIHLKRTLPGAASSVEVNNTMTNVTKLWKYAFTVRQMPDGTTYPLIKYNNAGEKVTYQVTETAPDFYVKMDEKQKEENGVVVTDFYNEPFKVKVQVEKIDEETKNPLSGAEFSVYAWSEKAKKYVPYLGTKDSVTGAEESVKLKEQGKGTYLTPVWLYYSTDNQGKFRLIETKAPQGYLGDWKDPAVTNGLTDKQTYDFKIAENVSKNGETIVISNTEGQKFGNQRVKGSILVFKLDQEGEVSKAQGDASLAEAVYELYAAEDIMHQDGSTGVLFKKDEKITVTRAGSKDGFYAYCPDPEGKAEIKTSQSAKFRIDGLELGTYYLRECKASEGYLVDPQKYEIRLSYVDEKTAVVTVQTQVKERVKKQPLSFYKYTSHDTSDVLEPMKGAGFSVYLVSELENGRYLEMTDQELVQAAIDELRNPTTLLYDTYQSYAPAKVFADASSEDVTSGRLVKETAYLGEKNYKADGEHEYYTAELTADEKGVVKVPELPYGRYLVIETKTPKGKLATRPFVIHVNSDKNDETIDGDNMGTPLQDQQLTVLIDRSIMSMIRIMKRDVYSKKIVLKEGAAYVIHDIEGAWFDYISKEMTSEQKKKYQKTYGDLVAQYSQGVYYGTEEDPFVTKLIKDGDETQNVYIETPQQLPDGIYELEEIAAPEGYILQGKEGVIDKKEGSAGNGTFYETESSGKWKKTPQGRVKFIVSNQESIYNEEIRSFVTTVRQDNEPAVGKISVFAEGEQLSGVKEGNASRDYEFLYEKQPVAGASFEIRAAEDIYSQEGGVNAKLLLKKGSLVTVLVTDEKGQAWTGQEDWEGTQIAKGLPLGKYTIAKVTAGDGFYLSEENTTPREIEISYAGQEVPVIYKDCSYESPRQKVKIEVKKTDAENGRKLSGAVFGLYTEREIVDPTGKVLVKADTLIAVAETKEADGKVQNALFAPDLPFGNYYVKELIPPAGYRTNPEKFAAEAAYAGETEAYAKVLCQVKDYKTKNAFVKTDILSGEKLSGAEFEIWEILTDEHGKLQKDQSGMYRLAEKASAVWTSDKDQEYVVEGLTIGKTYLLRERQAPWGYVGYEASDLEMKRANQDANTLDEEIMFIVQDTSEIVRHEIKDQRVTGNINITKEGEFLTEVEISFKDQLKNLIKAAFGYVLGRVENVTFAVYVKEDIFAPDGSGAFAEWINSEGKIMELRANTLIGEIVTDHNGIASVKGLPLGKYFVKEVAAGTRGNFLLSQEIQEVELCYADQYTPVVYGSAVSTMENAGAYYINERQKVKITVDKYEENEQGEKKPLKGAVFGLYTAEDIYGYEVKEDKTVRENITALIKAHTLLETTESDSKGNTIFTSDLPCGTYYVKEMKAPEGYLENPEILEIPAHYTGEEGEKTLEFHFEMQNQKSKIRIQKVDMSEERGISGAKLCLIEKSTDRKIAEWISDGKEKVLEGLMLSNTEEQIYILRELEPPKGYVTAKDIEFKLLQVQEEGKLQQSCKILVNKNGAWELLDENRIEMQDDVTKVEIRKGDQKSKKLLDGAKLELRDSDGKVLYSWISSKEQGFFIECLPIGTYRIVETETMKGYQQAKPLVIRVLDTDQKQVFTFENIPEEKVSENISNSTAKKPPIPIVQQTVQAVKTGDYAPIMLCTAGLLGSLAGLGITRKRKNN